MKKAQVYTPRVPVIQFIVLSPLPKLITQFEQQFYFTMLVLQNQYAFDRMILPKLINFKFRRSQFE